MNKLYFISMAIASAFVIEGCSSPNEENEQETVTYDILERNGYCVEYKCTMFVDVEHIYDTIPLANMPQLDSDIQTSAINELLASGTFTETQLMRVKGVEIDENGNQVTIPVDFNSADFKTYLETYKKYLHRAMSGIDRSKVAEIAAEYAVAEDKEAFLSRLKGAGETEYAAYYAIKYGYEIVNYKLADMDKWSDGKYVDWIVIDPIIYDTIWCWKPYVDKINSEETFTITDNNQIIRTVKSTNEATIFNIRNRIADTARIAEHLNSCSKSKFISYPSLQPLYYSTDKPSVLYEIEGLYDEEFMFVCKDEVHRSNKVFLYYFYKKGNDEHLESYTLVPVPVNNE